MKNLNTVLTQINSESIKFPIRETANFLQVPITNLDLDNRSLNALSRNGILTVKDLLNNHARLIGLRNFGRKSFNRTMYALCAYQYSQLSETEKQKYLIRLIELNLEQPA